MVNHVAVCFTRANRREVFTSSAWPRRSRVGRVEDTWEDGAGQVEVWWCVQRAPRWVWGSMWTKAPTWSMVVDITLRFCWCFSLADMLISLFAADADIAIRHAAADACTLLLSPCRLAMLMLRWFARRFMLFILPLRCFFMLLLCPCHAVLLLSPLRYFAMRCFRLCLLHASAADAAYAAADISAAFDDATLILLPFRHYYLPPHWCLIPFSCFFAYLLTPYFHAAIRWYVCCFSFISHFAIFAAAFRFYACWALITMLLCCLMLLVAFSLFRHTLYFSMPPLIFRWLLPHFDATPYWYFRHMPPTILLYYFRRYFSLTLWLLIDFHYFFFSLFAFRFCLMMLLYYCYYCYAISLMLILPLSFITFIAIIAAFAYFADYFFRRFAADISIISSSRQPLFRIRRLSFRHDAIISLFLFHYFLSFFHYALLSFSPFSFHALLSMLLCYFFFFDFFCSDIAAIDIRCMIAVYAFHALPLFFAAFLSRHFSLLLTLSFISPAIDILLIFIVISLLYFDYFAMLMPFSLILIYYYYAIIYAFIRLIADTLSRYAFRLMPPCRDLIAIISPLARWWLPPCFSPDIAAFSFACRHWLFHAAAARSAQRHYFRYMPLLIITCLRCWLFSCRFLLWRYAICLRYCYADAILLRASLFITLFDYYYFRDVITMISLFYFIFAYFHIYYLPLSISFFDAVSLSIFIFSLSFIIIDCWCFAYASLIFSFFLLWCCFITPPPFSPFLRFDYAIFHYAIFASLDIIDIFAFFFTIFSSRHCLCLLFSFRLCWYYLMLMLMPFSFAAISLFFFATMFLSMPLFSPRHFRRWCHAIIDFFMLCWDWYYWLLLLLLLLPPDATFSLLIRCLFDIRLRHFRRFADIFITPLFSLIFIDYFAAIAAFRQIFAIICFSLIFAIFFAIFDAASFRYMSRRAFYYFFAAIFIAVISPLSCYYLLLAVELRLFDIFSAIDRFRYAMRADGAMRYARRLILMLIYIDYFSDDTLISFSCWCHYFAIISSLIAAFAFASLRVFSSPSPYLSPYIFFRWLFTAFFTFTFSSSFFRHFAFFFDYLPSFWFCHYWCCHYAIHAAIDSAAITLFRYYFADIDAITLIRQRCQLMLMLFACCRCHYAITLILPFLMPLLPLPPPRFRSWYFDFAIIDYFRSPLISPMMPLTPIFFRCYAAIDFRHFDFRYHWWCRFLCLFLFFSFSPCFDFLWYYAILYFSSLMLFSPHCALTPYAIISLLSLIRYIIDYFRWFSLAIPWYYCRAMSRHTLLMLILLMFFFWYSCLIAIILLLIIDARALAAADSLLRYLRLRLCRHALLLSPLSLRAIIAISLLMIILPFSFTLRLLMPCRAEREICAMLMLRHHNIAHATVACHRHTSDVIAIYVTAIYGAFDCCWLLAILFCRYAAFAITPLIIDICFAISMIRLFMPLRHMLFHAFRLLSLLRFIAFSPLCHFFRHAYAWFYVFIDAAIIDAASSLIILLHVYAVFTADFIISFFFLRHFRHYFALFLLHIFRRFLFFLSLLLLPPFLSLLLIFIITYARRYASPCHFAHATPCHFHFRYLLIFAAIIFHCFHLRYAYHYYLRFCRILLRHFHYITLLFSDIFRHADIAAITCWCLLLRFMLIHYYDAYWYYAMPIDILPLRLRHICHVYASITPLLRRLLMPFAATPLHRHFHYRFRCHYATPFSLLRFHAIVIISLFTCVITPLLQLVIAFARHAFIDDYFRFLRFHFDAAFRFCCYAALMLSLLPSDYAAVYFHRHAFFDAIAAISLATMLITPPPFFFCWLFRLRHFRCHAFIITPLRRWYWYFDGDIMPPTIITPPLLFRYAMASMRAMRYAMIYKDAHSAR